MLGYAQTDTPLRGNLLVNMSVLGQDSVLEKCGPTNTSLCGRYACIAADGPGRSSLDVATTVFIQRSITREYLECDVTFVVIS